MNAADLGYFFGLGIQHVRRRPILTALMVLSIGFGVAISMISFSVFSTLSGDPIPWKSSVLYVPTVDVWGKGEQAPMALSYIDARALLREHRATKQAAINQITASIIPAEGKHPFSANGYAVSADFFRMLDVPFRYGSGWSADDDESQATKIVISSRLNSVLFGGSNSVGKTINVEGSVYAISGVVGDWDPQPKYFDLSGSGGFASTAEDIFLPIYTAANAGITNSGNMICRASPRDDGRDCVWISYLVEIGDKAGRDAYQNYIQAFAQSITQASQPKVDRTHLYALKEWLEYNQVVPKDSKISLWASMALLLVCVANTAGLLLAKFMARLGELGVRRALGATKLSILVQLLLEAGVIGLAGGVVGVILYGVGFYLMHQMLPTAYARLDFVDASRLILTLMAAILATLVAAIYPALRATRVAPAFWIKAT